jgi:hypothetical protein
VGPGAELLRAAAAGTQFVTLGENHNTRAIPELTVGLFRILHDAYGYDYLALEQGPALGRLLSARVRGGGAPHAAFRTGLELPSAFHMYSEEELRMIDRLAAISRAAQPIWGLNQEFGLLHVLDRLMQLAPDDAARQAAEAMRRESREYEGERFARGVAYINQPARAAQLTALRSAFRAAPGSEAEWLLAQATLSHEVFAPYATTPRPHFTAFFESGKRREDNMKALFAERYREAQQAGVAMPRVLVKS